MRLLVLVVTARLNVSGPCFDSRSHGEDFGVGALLCASASDICGNIEVAQMDST